MILTKDLRRFTAGWLAPSEQLNFLITYGDDVRENRPYWMNQARDVLGIDQKTFNEEGFLFLPSERYLQLYAKVGFPDYGICAHIQVETELGGFLVEAIKLDDVNLVAHLNSQVNDNIDLGPVVVYLARHGDHKGYLPLISFEEDDLVSFAIRRAVIEDDRKKLQALFEEKDRKIDEVLICTVYEEAIDRKDPGLIKFISSNITEPMSDQLTEALESPMEVFEAILNAIDWISNEDLEEIRDFALKRRYNEKVDLMVDEDIEEIRDLALRQKFKEKADLIQQRIDKRGRWRDDEDE
jgi:hypothetical protein